MAVIMKDRKPIAFYLQKINATQKRYTKTDRGREWLSAIKTWKSARNTRISC
jgi:DNA-binding PadR family transcriptional regulator